MRCGLADQDLRAGVGQDVADFIGFEEIIDRHHHSSGLQHTEECGDEFGAIPQPKPDPVTWGDAEIVLQARGERTDVRLQFFVGKFGVSPKDGCFGRMFLG